MSFYTFMPTLLNMSLTASVAIVLVTLLRLLLKKAPKVISYALWGVVLFRLLCPVSIGSDFSVYNLFDTPTEESGTATSIIEYVPSNIVHTEYPAVALPVPGISDAINETMPQGEEQLRRLSCFPRVRSTRKRFGLSSLWKIWICPNFRMGQPTPRSKTMCWSIAG